MVLALRAVYPIRDFKIVISVLIGPFLVAIPLLAGSLIVSPAHIESGMVAPLLNEKVARFISSDPESRDPRSNRISFHLDLLAYRFRAPRRFELVSFTPLRAEKGEEPRRKGRVLMGSGAHIWFNDELRDQLAGRIVGLPGDEVELAKGKLRINGRFWQENYLAPECRCEADIPPSKLGPSEYLILPEDRNYVDTYRGQLTVNRARITGRLVLTRLPLGWWLYRPTAFLQAVPAS